MEIRAPKWELVKERCPCCDGNGELVFSTCPKCGDLVLICAEVSSVFTIEGKNRGAVVSGDQCRKCTAVHYEDFRDATWQEIQSLGFVAGDYK